MKFPLHNLLTICLLTFCTSTFFAQSKIDLTDFNAAGDAVIRGERCFQLTYDRQWSAGSIWYKEAIDLNSSFEMELELMLGCKNSSGADGIVFVFHPNRVRVGYAGEGMGFAGLVPSLGIELDTWENDHLLDPAEDHIAVLRNGTVAHYNNLAGPVVIENVEDCKSHQFKIEWDAYTQELKIYLDGKRRLNVQEDIVKNIFLGNASVYWGITAGTGKYNNTHDVCFEKLSFDISLSSLFDIPGISQKLLTGKPSILRTVNFQSGRSTILPISFEELDQLATFLKQNPKLTVEISGHTDSVGDKDKNWSLSQKRAETIANYLKRKGISLNRISAVGHGESQPIASNDTESGRKKNRRIVIRMFRPIP